MDKTLSNYTLELDRLIDQARQTTPNPANLQTAPEVAAGLPAVSVFGNANLFFTASVLRMEAISHVIESQAQRLEQPFRFYSAFQKFSRFRFQEVIYRSLLATNNPVYIFGLPDSEIVSAPNLYKIALAEPSPIERTNLSNNWFVVLDCPEFMSMALLAREVTTTNSQHSRRAIPNRLIYRQYEGFWTYDKPAIKEIARVLQGYVQAYYRQTQPLVLQPLNYNASQIFS